MKFADRYQNLNQEQKAAVNTIEGPVLVVAGPGSGKTELLSLRVANILQKTDALASSILCLTFTEAAATNMRHRLASIIGAEAYKVAIHTFHSFGSEIINQNPEYFYHGALYTPADELTQTEILEEIFSSLDHNDPLSSFHPVQGYTYIRDVKSKLSDLKKAGISPQEFKEITLANEHFIKKANPLITDYFADRLSNKSIHKFGELIQELKKLTIPQGPNSNYPSLQDTIVNTLNKAYLAAEEIKKTKPITQWKKDHLRKNREKDNVLKESTQGEKNLSLADFYQKYQKKLEEKGLFDYDDMILDVVEAAEQNKELRYNLQEKYQFVLVDEFQDTSGVQMKLLDLILDSDINEGRPNVLAVGDDDQAIYKFQGAKIANILNFQKKYRDPEIIVLKKNYRSTEEVIQISREIIVQGEERLENEIESIDKTLEAGNTKITKGEIKEQFFNTEFEELVSVAEKIKQKIIEGHSPNEIAVISRKHKYLENVAKILNYFEVPINYDRKKNLLEEGLITEIITILKAIYYLSENEAKKVDHLIAKILHFDFLNLERLEIWKISQAAYSSHQSWSETLLEYPQPKLQEFIKFLIEASSLAQKYTGEEIIDLITGIKDLENGYRSPFKAHYFSEEKFKTQKSEYLDFLHLLQSFIQYIRNHKQKETLMTNEIINFLELLEKHRLPLIYQDHLNQAEDSVSLLTAHGSKGLEFETVFVINCQDEVWTRGHGSKLISFPSNLSISAEKENDDDHLRLFYVALSRAKRNIYLSHHLYNEKGRTQNKIRFLQDQNLESISKKSSEEILEMNKDFAQEKDLTELMELKFNLHNFALQTPEEKQLLQKLVENYQLSVTHFNNFLNVMDGGPQKFLEQNLLRFPQKENLGSSFGSAIHTALHEFHKAFKRTKKLPELDLLLDKYLESLKTRRLNEDDHQKLKKKGEDYLKTFYQNRHQDFSMDDKLEFNFRNQGVKIQEAEITGKIDRMRLDQNKKEITVYDYKTGKILQNWEGKSDSEKLKAWQYRNQLIFYKLLVENSRQFRSLYRVEQGALEFIRPEDGQSKLLELEINDADTTQLARLVNIVFAKIKKLDFPDTSQYEQNFRGVEAFVSDLINQEI